MNDEKLEKYAEKKANQFNVYCLIVVSCISFLALILNEVGIFSINKVLLRIAMFLIVFIAILPLIVLLFNKYIIKNNQSILEYSWFKIFIITCSFLCALVLCVILSFHAVLVLVLPTLMAAQYKNSNSMNIMIFISSMILILISVFGSFLFGIYDANLLKPLSKEEAKLLSNRIAILKTSRIVSIITHYVMPRMLAVGAIEFVGLSITKRNSYMLEMQIDLSNKVNKEIIERTNMQNGVIMHLADIIESRDIETGEHIKRTKNYVSILVNKMKEDSRFKDELPQRLCDIIINAAPLHDIGKIAVSDLILCKPGKLTIEEYEKMKIHTTKGGEIIKNILIDLGDEEFLGVAYDVAISHHEKWNGLGYPKGLKEKEIPLSGRIMAIADVFDALIAERVYKKPIPFDEAVNIIISESGSHFDPDIVDIFKKVLDDFKVASTKKL